MADMDDTAREVDTFGLVGGFKTLYLGTKVR